MAPCALEPSLAPLSKTQSALPLEIALRLPRHHPRYRCTEVLTATLHHQRQQLGASRHVHLCEPSAAWAQAGTLRSSIKEQGAPPRRHTGKSEVWTTFRLPLDAMGTLVMTTTNVPRHRPVSPLGAEPPHLRTPAIDSARRLKISFGILKNNIHVSIIRTCRHPLEEYTCILTKNLHYMSI